MTLRSLSCGALLSVIVVLGTSAHGFADPPARVGRLNYLSGSVSFRPAESDDWGPARINVPLTAGDHLWTDGNSRAEIHVGSTAVRLAPETAFAFLNLDDQTIQIRLTQGGLNLRVRQLGANEVFEIDTPNVTVSVLRPGLYRINVDPAGNTTVTDREGESEVTAAGAAFTVHPREMAIISGTDSPAYDVQPVTVLDEWDTWCAKRDQREAQSASVRYVSREMVGYEDLDEYGVWRVTPEYGPVWFPAQMAAGWAPYRNGHWIWMDPWGWTWVDDMPWGFAPFHYGRWAYISGGWGWIPGRPAPRPVYAPALVAFVGGNSWHVSLSLGGGGVAWFPLGPREVYVPAYHASPTYVQNINVTHVTNVNVTNVNVTNVTYVNRTVPGAVSAVPQQAFVGAQSVSKAAVAVPPQAIAAAPVSGMTAPVAPRPESLAAKPAAATPVARPPEAAMNRAVVARATPQAPVSFAARQSAMAATPGRPVDEDTLATLRQKTPAAPPLVKPAIPASAPAQAKAPVATLRPAREGVAQPHPAAPVNSPVPAVPVAGSSPAAKPAPVQAPAPAQTASQPNAKQANQENDRPNRGNAPPSSAAPVRPNPNPPAPAAAAPPKPVAPRPEVKPTEVRPAAKPPIRESDRPTPAPAKPETKPQPERGHQAAPESKASKPQQAPAEKAKEEREKKKDEEKK